jgi:glycosyltransferase involved in cell wall biosynthesis
MKTEHPADVCGVSVVMPVYNGERYLDAAVECILQQSFTNFEFLIIDDGSTDGTGDLLRKWEMRDKRIRLLSGSHHGISAALNRGLAAARSPIIARMDADDVSLPNRLERQVSFLKDHPAIAVVGSGVRFINTKGEPRSIANKYPRTPEDAVASLSCGNTPVAHPAVAMRRDAVLSVGGYRSLFDYAEDFDLWVRLMEHKHQIANLPEVLLDLRIHDQKTSGTRRWEQALAAHIARFSARSRRDGRPDPMENVSRLELKHLAGLHLSPPERSSVLIDLAEAALVSFEAQGLRKYLFHARDCLMTMDNLTSERDRRVVRQLISSLWKVGERTEVIGFAARIVRRSTLGRSSRSADQRKAVNRWLAYCADPTGPHTDRPERVPSPAAMRQLIAESDAHGVLPAVMQTLSTLTLADEYKDAMDDALARRRIGIAFSTMLRLHADAISNAAGDLPLTVVRGQTFARLIYPESSLRPFTDIDLLVAPEAVPAVSAIIESQGFVTVTKGRDPQRPEARWLHRDNDMLTIKVATNLVHHPKLSASLSLAYADVAEGPHSPAALLTIATLHGALQRFERLHQVADICQAARSLSTSKDEAALWRMLDRTGGRFAAVAGLELAYRIFREPRCREIARAIGPVRYASLAGALVGQSAVVSTMGYTRAHYSWRRQLFRMLLMNSRTLSALS